MLACFHANSSGKDRAFSWFPQVPYLRAATTEGSRVTGRQRPGGRGGEAGLAGRTKDVLVWGRALYMPFGQGEPGGSTAQSPSAPSGLKEGMAAAWGSLSHDTQTQSRGKWKPLCLSRSGILQTSPQCHFPNGLLPSGPSLAAVLETSL